MSSSQPALCLGVDGGGTKTVAWLGYAATDSVTISGRGFAGPSNPRSAGFETALSNVQAAIAGAFGNARLQKSPVAAACFCLAGAARAAEQQQIAEWVSRQGIANKFSIVSDAEALLAATPHDHHFTNQVALIAGTGSIAWGRAGQGPLVRCGGWGYLLDDAGSGYWIGQQLLRVACSTADGRCNEPDILEAILRATSCVQPEQLIEWTYGSAMPRTRIAALAGVAFELAASSQVATEIVERGAEQLAKLASQVVRSLEVEEYGLALAGGVFCRQPGYVEKVQYFLRNSAATPSQVCVIEDPVLGALNLAIDQLRDS